MKMQKIKSKTTDKGTVFYCARCNAEFSPANADFYMTNIPGVGWCCEPCTGKLRQEAEAKRKR